MNVSYRQFCLTNSIDHSFKLFINFISDGISSLHSTNSSSSFHTSSMASSVSHHFFSNLFIYFNASNNSEEDIGPSDTNKIEISSIVILRKKILKIAKVKQWGFHPLLVLSSSLCTQCVYFHRTLSVSIQHRPRPRLRPCQELSKNGTFRQAWQLSPMAHQRFRVWQK